MKRNIVICAFLGILVFCCLAVPVNAQTLNTSNIEVTYLKVGDKIYQENEFSHIISITLPTSSKPCKITLSRSHPITQEPTVETIVTTLPMEVHYVPR